MVMTNRKATFACDVKTIWKIITSLEDYAWRSDISKIEIVKSQKQFIEYTKGLYPTTFTITVFEPYQRYEFTMENSRMTGYWIGLFNEKDGFTTIDFTEDVTPKKIYMKPFVKSYLKKQQQTYIHDLKKVLETL